LIETRKPGSPALAVREVRSTNAHEVWRFPHAFHEEKAKLLAIICSQYARA
jgi:hypothetical protein